MTATVTQSPYADNETDQIMSPSTFSALTRPLKVSAIVLAGLIGCVVAATSAQAQVVVMVNGEPITRSDIQQRAKLIRLSSRTNPSEKQVIDELIDEKVKIREAKKYGVDPSASEIDSAFGNMAQRMRLSSDQLAHSLESQGIRPDTLKSRIKADMVWTSLVRGRFQQSLIVGEKDIHSAVPLKEEGQPDNFEYQMRPLVLLVPRGAGAGAAEARQKEAEALRGRIKSCGEALAIFRTMRNVAIRDTVTKTSGDLPEQLRAILDKTPVGQLTPPEVTQQGIEMVALCNRKTANADTPQMREVRNKMYAEKFEAKSKSYLETVRRSAMIEYR